MITIVDYGVGNIGSVQNMLRHIGVECRRDSNPDAIAAATKLILPGVGAFDAGMKALRGSDLVEPLRTAVLVRGAPILGICLGMQMLLDESEEGVEPGLGWIPGRVRRFEFADSGLRVPHMGWNEVHAVNDSALFRGMPLPARFYFVHSYFVEPTEPSFVSLSTRYGLEFASGVERGHIYGVQFHPEKSHRYGMKLLKAFAEI